MELKICMLGMQNLQFMQNMQKNKGQCLDFTFKLQKRKDHA